MDARRGKVHAEDGIDRAGVAFGDGHIIDRNCWRAVVVEHGAGGLTIGQGKRAGQRQIDEEALGVFKIQVADDRHDDGATGNARREGERAGGRRVVGAGDG